MKNTLIIAGLMTATLAMAQPQPISYNDLVKTGTKLAEGVLPVYKHDNRVYMEFARQLDGREMELRGQIDCGFGLIDRAVKSIGVVKLSVPDSATVVLNQPFYHDRILDNDSPLTKAFNLSNGPTVGRTYCAAVVSDKGNPIVDITELVEYGMEWFDCSQYSAIRSLVEGSSRLTEVHASASGVAMSIERQYETEAEQYSFNSMAIILPNASKPLLTSYYFNLLPPNGEPIRLCARDIAAQTIHMNDYSQNPYTMVEDSLVVRWATNVPCVFYIDSLMPQQYRGAVVKGIESWNPVLAKAGVKKRLTAKPLGKQTKAVEQAIVVAYDFGGKGVTSEKTVHPRTGEILSCRLNIGHNGKSPITADELTKNIRKEVAQILGIAPNANDQQTARALKYLYNPPANSNVYKDRERMIGIVKGK